MAWIPLKRLLSSLIARLFHCSLKSGGRIKIRDAPAQLCSELRKRLCGYPVQRW